MCPEMHCREASKGILGERRMHAKGLLNGSVALVTGGSRGIGAAVAEAYGAAGAAVAVNYVSGAEAARSVVARIEEAGGRAIAVQADIGDLNSHEALLAAVETAFGPIRILVNNAAIEVRKEILEYKPADWDRHFDVNLKGAFFLAQRVARRMIEVGVQGRIIQISSTHETKAMKSNALYSITKAGLAMATKSLALELAPHGITVNSVIPGAIRTDINREVLADQAYENKVTGLIPLGRIGVPDDCVGAALFLASDSARYMTGASVAVDGGLLL
jgi:glucose 1-dehydrogenase